MVTHCEICDDIGMVPIVKDGKRAMQPCPCAERRRLEQAIRRIKLPTRYDKATLENFDTQGKDPTITTALVMAKRYVQEYTPGGQNQGLVLFGSVGTGKTHIAAAIVRELVITRGAVGIFTDFRDLLKTIQATYNVSSDRNEMSVLAPVLDADVLVLDELGAMRSSDWVADAIEFLLNARYNSDKATIITTNYAMRGPAILHGIDSGPTGYERRAAVREETLGDRIGARMFSRLTEMCRPWLMQGADYRQQGAKKASF